MRALHIIETNNWNLEHSKNKRNASTPKSNKTALLHPSRQDDKYINKSLLISVSACWDILLGRVTEYEIRAQKLIQIIANYALSVSHNIPYIFNVTWHIRLGLVAPGGARGRIFCFCLSAMSCVAMRSFDREVIEVTRKRYTVGCRRCNDHSQDSTSPAHSIPLHLQHDVTYKKQWPSCCVHQ